MKKLNISVVLCWCLLSSVFAQNKATIQLKDSISLEPLAFGHILLVQKNILQYTDLNGIVQLDENPVAGDTIRCSYLGYADKSLVVAAISEGDTLSVLMVPDAIALDMVEVNEEARLESAYELIKNAVNNIPSNYPQGTEQLKAIYREILWEDDRCIELNESFNRITYTDYPQKKFVRKSWKKYWTNEFREKYPRQQCEGILLALGHPQFFKYYNTVKDHCEIITSRLSDNHSTKEVHSYYLGGPLALTAIDKVKYLADFLDPKLKDKYEYFRKNATYIDSTLCIAVGFRPKPSIQPIHQLWNKKIGFAFFAGTVYIALDSYAILGFECQWAKEPNVSSYRFSEPWQIFPNAMEIMVRYRKDSQGTYRLHFVENKQRIKAFSSIKWRIPADYVAVRRLYIEEALPNIQTNEVLSLPYQQFANLRQLPCKYDASHWQQIESSEAYPELDEDAIQHLQLNEPLRDQFQKNCAKDQ